MKGVMLAVLLVTALAQAVPSCSEGDRPSVVGWIASKRIEGGDSGGTYVITINQADYEVPLRFWMIVNVGDLVKYDKGDWTIVRKGG
ncbi:MAG: hypothetical protein HY660_01210 [Armatimonadetes bacterium]|nr:hypothetical protein [Armatimonadota bacterium]